MAKRGKIAVQFSPGIEKQENAKKNNVNEANIFKMQSPEVLLGNRAKFYAQEKGYKNVKICILW